MFEFELGGEVSLNGAIAASEQFVVFNYREIEREDSEFEAVKALLYISILIARNLNRQALVVVHCDFGKNALIELVEGSGCPEWKASCPIGSFFALFENGFEAIVGK